MLVAGPSSKDVRSKTKTKRLPCREANIGSSNMKKQWSLRYFRLRITVKCCHVNRTAVGNSNNDYI